MNSLRTAGGTRSLLSGTRRIEAARSEDGTSRPQATQPHSREVRMTAGYSGTPLVRKLGIREGMTCAFLDAPAHYRTLLTGLPENLTITGDGAADLDFVHLFVDRADGLMQRLRGLRERIVPNGIIWVSWPKKASGVTTDVTESVVREAGLSAKLVDVKICAVDETWSGLKFVIRRADRPS